MQPQATYQGTAPTITKDSIKQLLQTYDANKSLYSSFYPALFVKKLRKLTKKQAPDVLNQDNINELFKLIFIDYEIRKKDDYFSAVLVATNNLAFGVLEKIFDAKKDDVKWFMSIRDEHIIDNDQDKLKFPIYDLLTNQHRKANFDAIIAQVKYINHMFRILDFLYKFHLLTQDNFNKIVWIDGQYFDGIRTALFVSRDCELTQICFDKICDVISKKDARYAADVGSFFLNIVSGEPTEIDFQRITQVHGKYAKNVVSALHELHRCYSLIDEDSSVRVSDEERQDDYNAITQDGGQYAKSVSSILVKFLNPYDPRYRTTYSKQVTHHYRAAIIKHGGQYAENIAKALVTLNSAKLLSDTHCDIISQKGGQYAENIANVLVKFKSDSFLERLMIWEANPNQTSDAEGIFYLTNALLKILGQNQMNEDENLIAEGAELNLLPGYFFLRDLMDFFNYVYPFYDLPLISFFLTQLLEGTSQEDEPFLPLHNVVCILSSVFKSTPLDRDHFSELLIFLCNITIDNSKNFANLFSCFNVILRNYPDNMDNTLGNIENIILDSSITEAEMLQKLASLYMHDAADTKNAENKSCFFQPKSASLNLPSPRNSLIGGQIVERQAQGTAPTI